MRTAHEERQLTYFDSILYDLDFRTRIISSFNIFLYEKTLFHSAFTQCDWENEQWPGNVIKVIQIYKRHELYPDS